MTAASFDVRVSGQGPPMVLLPGASCNSVVWTEVEDHFRGRFEMHLVELSGFAGRPRLAGPLLATARHELADYLSRVGNAPAIVVGHSLGAFLVYAVAADVPEAVGAAVAIDGVPALGQIIAPGGTAAVVEHIAQTRRRRLATLSPDQFRRYLAGAFRAMVVAPSAVDRVVEHGGRSDPRAVADAMYELWTTDLRPLLPSIRAPLLFIAPEWAGADPQGGSARLALYRQQLAAVPNHRMVVIEEARHFVMLDQPAAMLREMDRFIAANQLDSRSS